MGAQMLKIHWKASKWILLPCVVAAFGLPLAASRMVWRGQPNDWINPGVVLDLASGYAVFFPLLAAMVGAIVALTAWNWDHQTGHVYPLTLPISRSRYAALKFAAGAVILTWPTAMLLVGSAVATGLMDLPLGLNAYPLDLTLRFFLGSLLVYGLFFALAAGRMRTAVIVLGSVVLLGLFGEGLAGFLQASVPALDSTDLWAGVEAAFLGPHGLFGIFADSWTLIDV